MGGASRFTPRAARLVSRPEQQPRRRGRVPCSLRVKQRAIEAHVSVAISIA